MDVTIVGAGMAGLSAAVELAEAGCQVQVFEAGDRPGGRVATDEVDGHLLDRGFQVVLAAYPDLWQLVDSSVLDLRFFIPGARIRVDGAFHKVADPFQDPASAFDTIRSPIGSLGDKFRVVGFRRRVRKGPVEDLWRRPEVTARQRLEDLGFGEQMIDRFLAPLFAGITLAPELDGSSRMLEFVYRMMSEAGVGVPAEGMAALPATLARRLPDGALHLSTPVERVDGTTVVPAGGDPVAADAVIVATDATTAADLAGTDDHGWRPVTTAWFSAEASPLPEPILALNGEGDGPINSVAVMSDVAPAYAPAGRSTIAVSAPRIEEGLIDGFRRQLGDWFPASADWDLLRVDEITQALPRQAPGHDPFGPLNTPDGVWVCGDHRTDPSINGAVASGRAVAAAMVERLESADLG